MDAALNRTAIYLTLRKKEEYKKVFFSFLNRENGNCWCKKLKTLNKLVFMTYLQYIYIYFSFISKIYKNRTQRKKIDELLFSFENLCTTILYIQ